MFSGIVAECGRVEAFDPATGVVRIRSSVAAAGARAGDSIAVNGCCLTVTSRQADGFTADLMPETLACTTLATLTPGDGVNLEAALRFEAPVGGHLVSGHVDGVGEVLGTVADGNARRVRVRAPSAVVPLIAAKGSVAVDGISLTVTDVDGDVFGVSLIPHTLAVTTAGAWTEGTPVNLEGDLVARYVQRGIAAHIAMVGA